MPTYSNQGVSVVSLGCRLNAGESEEMRRHALDAGLSNAVLVNTCAVTAEAVRQGRQTIRRIRRDQPTARVIVTGCAAQIEPGRFADMSEVDHVVGNAEKVRPETYRTLVQHAAAPRVIAADIMTSRDAAGPRTDAVPGMPRAFVQIQNGCDHRCTFCVIPFGRGRSRSVSADEVVARIITLVERGVPEVVLTGVDITAWGDDLPGAPRLGTLVRRILADVPLLARLRLSSIDQSEMDGELLVAIAEEPRLMPHLHLSLQSGSDLILKRMKRRHSRAQAIAFCAEVRRLRPDIALGADVIAGFPTETEQHFRDTLSIVDDCGLAFLHVFPYSAREGTPAARMPPVRGEVVAERSARLRGKGQSVLDEWLQGHVSRRFDVALERTGDGEVPARTPQFTQVTLSGVALSHVAGETVGAVVRGHDGKRLLAEAVT